MLVDYFYLYFFVKKTLYIYIYIYIYKVHVTYALICFRNKSLKEIIIKNMIAYKRSET